MARRVKIALVAIARDEAEELPGMLASAEPFVDLAVVADTGSTDETPRVAAEAGAEVVSVPWRDDFARARNEAAEATMRFLGGAPAWLLILDADERVEGDQEAVRAAVERVHAMPDADALAVWVENMAGGRPAFSLWQPRLYRGDLGRIRWVGSVHNELKRSRGGGCQPVRWIHLDRSILTVRHFGYEEAAMRRKRKHERNLTMLRAALASGDDRQQVRFHLGRELALLGTRKADPAALREAIGQLASAAKIPSGSPLTELAAVAEVEARLELGRLEGGEAAEAALLHLEAALARYPRNARLWYLLAVVRRVARDGRGMLRALRMSQLASRCPDDRRAAGGSQGEPE